MEKIFERQNTYESDELLQKDLKEINTFSQKNVHDLTAKETNKLIALHERSAISLRRILESEEKGEADEFFQKKGFRDCDIQKEQNKNHSWLENLPVKIEKKNDMYHIFTPYTFKRGMAESYILSNYLRAAIAKEQQNGMLFEMREKCIVTVLRVSNQTVRRRFRDNDNLETSAMINVIFSETFVKSDNVLNMSFFSDYMESEDESVQGFHLFVIPYSSKIIKGEELLRVFTNEN